jgi:tRNA threonylcarbamoyladenosine biosynthesis protein TsaE
MRTYTIASLENIAASAAVLLADYPDKRIFAFHGELGAGKTTFIKALCESLGVADAMSSPSFSIVNEYRDRNGQPVYHFDLYRLRQPEEALDIGFEEYLYSGNYCFIEWPEKAGELLPEETVHVDIRENDGKREITVC